MATVDFDYRQSLIKSVLGKLFWSLLFLPVFAPASYVFSSSVNRAFSLLGYFSVGMTVILFFVYRAKVDGWVLLLFAGFLLTGCSTLLMGSMGAPKSHLTQAIEVLSFIILIEIGLKNDTRFCLDGFALVASVTIMICAYTMFKYRDAGGMRGNAGMLLLVWGRRQSKNWYYLGHDTGSILTILPALTVIAVRDLVYKKKLGKVLIACYVATLASCFYVSSAAATVALILLAVLYLLFMRIDFKPIPFNAVLLYGALSSALSVSSHWYHRIENLITDILRKTPDLTGRELIWDRAIVQIKQNPILGSGTLNDGTLSLVLGINHCHNLLLEYLFRGGLAGLLLFASAFVFSGRKMQKLGSSQLRSTIIAALISYLTICIVDGYFFNPVSYVLFGLANNCLYLQHEQDGREDAA